jgi:voltage-gated potassium channel Kch
VGQDVQRRADRLLDRISREPLKGAWRATAIITFSVTVVAGLLIRVTDPDTFGSIWAGLWWAVQTTTTVGYGDLVPQSTAGRSIAALVMLAGIGFITVSTAAISSAFVEASRRRREALGAGSDADALLTAQAAEIRALREDVQALAAEVRALRDPEVRP